MNFSTEIEILIDSYYKSTTCTLDKTELIGNKFPLEKTVEWIGNDIELIDNNTKLIDIDILLSIEKEEYNTIETPFSEKLMLVANLNKLTTDFAAIILGKFANNKTTLKWYNRQIMICLC